MTSPLLRVASAQNVRREVEVLRNRTEPSMKKKLPPPGCCDWKPPGVPPGSFTPDCREWAKTAMIGGRQLVQPRPRIGL